MAGQLVLITGATGHVGFKAMLVALEAGYHVRAAVRSQAKADALLNNKTLKALNRSAQLSFVVVPDLQSDGAYDDAVKDVTYIIHIASPIMNGDTKPEQYTEFFIKPAVTGTLGMLKSAAKAPSVKRIVVTSSIVAIVPYPPGPDVYNAESRTPSVTEGFSDEFAAYCASKAAALNEAESWMEQNNPSFDIIHVHPSFVEGRDDLVTEAPKAISGTNAVVLGAVLGSESDSAVRPGVSVHNDDVARIHVDSLKPEVPGNTSYIAHWNPAGTLEGTKWEQINEIAAELFPEEVKSGKLPNKGGVKQSIPIKLDSSKTEEVFGFVHKGLKEQVKDVVGWYLELLDQKA
ncbi:NAD(P)-binding protein [Aulographum hederae CBS 113979]|uniref:NAD(P)-binding protein n=1 Tax=Aulographum hederae CBS 113979 TaxID=1176131 RepID=A0A6G1GIZ0_9PEZI|nr:NAD(P)-binding protein [Aulographum hederae CBS 113979]